MGGGTLLLLLWRGGGGSLPFDRCSAHNRKITDQTTSLRRFSDSAFSRRKYSDANCLKKARTEELIPMRQIGDEDIGKWQRPEDC